MNIWVRKSLKVGLIAGGFVAIGTGVASAHGSDSPAAGLPSVNLPVVSGQQSLLGDNPLNSGTSDPLGKVLDNATQLTTTVLRGVTPPAASAPGSKAATAIPGTNRQARRSAARKSAAAKNTAMTHLSRAASKTGPSSTLPALLKTPATGGAATSGPVNIGLPTGALGSIPVLGGGLPSLPILGGGGLPSLPSLPGLPGLPILGGTGSLPALPAVAGGTRAMPNLSTPVATGGLPGVTSVPVLGALPGMPTRTLPAKIMPSMAVPAAALPKASDLPSFSQALPGIPTTLPSLDGGLPSLPDLSNVVSGSLTGGYGVHLKPGLADIPAGLDLGFGQRDGQAADGPLGLKSALGLLGVYAVIPTGGNHEIEILDMGVTPRAKTANATPPTPPRLWPDRPRACSVTSRRPCTSRR